MSVLLMGQVWALDLRLGDQAVALALADHAKDDGTDIYPSIGLLAWKVGLSERQVQRILRKLEQMQLIVPVAFASGGRGRATCYEMHVAAGPQKSPYQRQKGDICDSEKGDICDTDLKRVTSVTEKGDISDKRVTSVTEKGDIAMSPQPSYNHQLEPSRNRNARAHARDISPPENQNGFSYDDFWRWLRRQPGGPERFDSKKRERYMARYERELERRATA